MSSQLGLIEAQNLPWHNKKLQYFSYIFTVDIRHFLQYFLATERDSLAFFKPSTFNVFIYGQLHPKTCNTLQLGNKIIATLVVAGWGHKDFNLFSKNRTS